MKFGSEKELVDTFVSLVDKTLWEVYPETADFDLLLVRRADGAQLGIEAKLSLNMKVVAQAADLARNPGRSGPDYRAVLVPWAKVGSEFEVLTEALQVVILRVGGRAGNPQLSRRLPEGPNRAAEWPEHFPASRCPLPDYVPDVAAGVKGPMKLTLWKVKAIKLVILLHRRGYLTRKDFIRFDCSPSVWTQRQWLIQGDVRGQWIDGGRIPDFRAQHPVNFAQIEADFEKWNWNDLEGVI